jgi:hypothetical protein
METVHANQPETTSETNTGFRSRSIQCHGCEGNARSGCGCLTDGRIVRRMREAVNQLLVKGADPARSDHARAESRRAARQRLQRLADQAEQAEREWTSFLAFCRALKKQQRARYSARRDRDLLEFMFFDHLAGNQIQVRSVETTAELFKRPVPYVRDLRDRCLAALQTWAVDDAATSTVARSVA